MPPAKMRNPENLHNFALRRCHFDVKQWMRMRSSFLHKNFSNLCLFSYLISIFCRNHDVNKLFRNLMKSDVPRIAGNLNRKSVKNSRRTLEQQDFQYVHVVDYLARCRYEMRDFSFMLQVRISFIASVVCSL
jgi:hypothetical protein